MNVRAVRRGADPRIGLLLEVLDQAFDQRGWHGTTLRAPCAAFPPTKPYGDRLLAGTISGS